MSDCLDLTSPMTGSTKPGLLQPQEDSSPLPAEFESSFDRSNDAQNSARRDRSRRTRSRRRMTSHPPNAQQIQLTPLWEHVVRTRRFPTEIDISSTFVEISERLRDPEWEVRQHALRVLVDVLPTLNADIVDEVMQPVVPELIDNLGHPAPAVRKGALDTLRVYLLHTADKNETAKNILQGGLKQIDGRDSFRSNVTTGIILSAPSLLFPSSSGPRPAKDLLKETITTLSSYLNQPNYREAVLESLGKIRNAIGSEEFECYLSNHPEERLKRNTEVVPKRPESRETSSREKSPKDSRGTQKKLEKKDKNKENEEEEEESDTSGIAEEEEEMANDSFSAQTRVVLETEIKFDEKTAITMTILEEKDDSETDQLDGNDGVKVVDNGIVPEVEVVEEEEQEGRRKTSRRVHFGGEVVKLRTPDSDETETTEVQTPKTRIPLPVSPVTKRPPEKPRRRPFSQPCSPLGKRDRPRRFFTGSASSSPKKSILSTTSSFVSDDISMVRQKLSNRKRFGSHDSFKTEEEPQNSEKISGNSDGKVKVAEVDVNQSPKKEEMGLVRSGWNNELQVHNANDNNEDFFGDFERQDGAKDNQNGDDGNSVALSSLEKNFFGESTEENDNREGAESPSKRSEEDKNSNLTSKSNQRGSGRSRTRGGPGFDAFPRQERNYILMELSSPERHAMRKEEKQKKLEENHSQDPNSKSPNFDLEEKSTRSTSPVQIKSVDSNVSVSNSSEVIRIDESSEQFVETDEKSSTEKSTTSTTNLNKNETEIEVTKNKNTKRKNETKVISSPDVSKDDERAKTPKGRDREEEVNEETGSVTCSSSEGENNSQEPSWEELGLVDREVLDDLHNKDDWRARVRGLERVASALRTSSALIAIEPRLGSLLHAVLGGERSCRVAAAGLAVAKVVVAGVSEEALRRRLPQLAWGLARQGGPNAAQLARIAMLRLRPALLLEQFLQPQCLAARNAKTRENALQLLIFSLVTFPSTEFKVETVARRVALMVADRRRRVRQAALDTLAVLAQIYESEEVLQAGKRASIGRHDAEAMMSAIRARLARKSLPLVSADGLVVYGLQISPTVQIATGPDVDWIVAGSGSVSPGTGRTRGQIIATTAKSKDRGPRTESIKRENPWTDRASLVALGTGLRTRNEQPVAWQIVPTRNEDDPRCPEVLQFQENRDSNSEVRNGKYSEFKSKDQSHDIQEINDNSVEDRRNFRNAEKSLRDKNSKAGSSLASREDSNLKAESRIPIYSRGAISKSNGQSHDRSSSTESHEIHSINSRRETRESIDDNNTDEDGSYSTSYQRRKRSQQETSSMAMTFDSHYTSYRPICTKTVGYTSKDGNGNRRFVEDENSKSFEVKIDRARSHYVESRQFSLPKNAQRPISNYDHYESTTGQRTKQTEDSFRPLQTAPPLSRIYDRYDSNRRIDDNDRHSLTRMERKTRDVSSQKVTEIEQNSRDVQTNGGLPSPRRPELSPYRRRLRSLSPPQPQRRHFPRTVPDQTHATSLFDIDKAVTNEEEYNERNKQDFHDQVDSYRITAIDPDRLERRGEEHADSKSGSISSETMENDRQRGNFVLSAGSRALFDEENNDRSSTPRSREADKAFDVIASKSDAQERDELDSYIMPKRESSMESTNASAEEEETSKDWSSEEEAAKKITNGPIRDENGNGISDESSDDENEELPLPIDDGLGESIVVDVTCYSPTKPVTPKRSELPVSNRSPEIFENSPSKRTSRCSSRKSLTFQNEESRESSEERASSNLQNENVPETILGSGRRSRRSSVRDSPASLHSSHSRENLDRATPSAEHADNVQEHTEESSVNDTLEEASTKDVAFTTLPVRSESFTTLNNNNDDASETNTEPGILKIEPPVEPVRKTISKVPRRIKPNKNPATEKPTEKSKPIVQQCFAQLDNKDWEVTLKGLKSLSQIAKQHPECLDACAGGTIGRLLGRHIRSLRSQISRAACLASGDLFSSQIRGIDQDLDDIATPLLLRTADTNRFLRADSNTALDLMIEHLPPQKTISIIVYRGSNHQNAVVRATTARLLSSIVERVGSDQAMSLPRDVRDKMLNTGARLLIDGNLDARNHAKRMFRRLTSCDGFRRALTDAVPETTLRHIDKTLKSL